MPEINKCLTTNSEITQLQILDDNSIAFATREHGIKIFTQKTCKAKLELSNEKLGSKTTATAFSPNSKLLAFANSDTIYVVDIPTNNVIQVISTDVENIEILAFDISCSYIIAGSTNGRVLQYRYDNSSLLARLCSFPYIRKDKRMMKIRQNFVSAFAFSNNKIACSGYGGAILIIDLHSRVNKSVLTHSVVRINALCFLDEDTLISGNIDGVIQIMSLKDKRVHKKIITPFTQIKQIILMPNRDYIMVSFNTNVLALIDIKEHKIVNSKYIECTESISKVALLNNESLLVALNNKNILTIELPSVEQLRSLITHNSLDEAFNLIDKEPMIRGSIEHTKLKEKYNTFYSKAVDALINNNKDLALQLTDMFKNIPSKKHEIKALFTGFEQYSRFKTIIQERKYAVAYAMSSKYPALKYTTQYKQMEKAWKIAFGNAQKQIIMGRADMAKSILNEYMTTEAKRPLIKFVLNHNKEFLEFLRAIDNKEFTKVNELAKKHTTFAQIPNYIALNHEIQNYIDEAKESIKSGNVEQAKVFLEKLADTPYLADAVNKLHTECKYVEKLYESYNEDDFISCYETLDSHRCLNSVELGVFLEKHWSKRINRCEEYALNGNLKGVKKTLGSLIKLRTRKEKIGDLLRATLHTRLKQLISKKNFKEAENIIYSYMDIFGSDNEIEFIKKRFEKYSKIKLAITQDQTRQYTRESWFDSEFTTEG